MANDYCIKQEKSRSSLHKWHIPEVTEGPVKHQMEKGFVRHSRYYKPKLESWGLTVEAPLRD